MTMTATRKISPPNSVNPDRITAMTISATNSAAATPTAHNGSVNVPVERSSQGNQSRLIRAVRPSNPAPVWRSAARRATQNRAEARAYCSAANRRAVRGRCLVYLRARELHDVGPLLDVFAEVFVELGGRHRHRHGTLLGLGFLHIGPREDLVNLAVELFDDLFWRASRRHDAKPDGR